MASESECLRILKDHQKEEEFKKKVLAIVTEQLQAQKWNDYVMAVLTGHTFENRVDTLTTNKVNALVPGKVSSLLKEDLPARVKILTDAAVAAYMEAHFLKELKARLVDVLPNMVADQATKHLSYISGIDDLMSRYRSAITAEFTSWREGMVREMTQHTTDILAIRAHETTTFQKETRVFAETTQLKIKSTADQVVHDLVGTNGSVIQGFVEEIKKQGQDRLNSTINRVGQQEIYITNHNVRLAELHQRVVTLESRSNIQVLATVFLVGVTAALGAALYMR